MADQSPPDTDGRLSRRLFITKVVFGATAAAVVVGAVAAPTATQAQVRRVTDSDPWDPGGRVVRTRPRVRRVTDNDPWDPGGRPVRRVVRPRRRVTDSDPFDAAGRGRGW